MRSVEQQLALVTQSAVAPEPVRIAIAEALGLMCAEEVQASRALPGFDQAAIDGYAVRAVDVGGERGLGRPIDAPIGPIETSLPVVGEVPAGSQRPLRLQPKQAVRVHTGAPLPTLSDAVIPLEWTDCGRKRMTAHRPVRSGEFVRHAGDDIRPGDVAVSDGAILSPAHIGLLAAVGRSKVLVYPRPRMSVISVGHELVEIDREPSLGQVFDVNSYALAAAGRDAGADVHRVGIAAGEPRRLREIVESQLLRSEIIVIAGAVGGSGSEEIRRILSDLGEIDTTRVAMHPGSVQGFGLLGENQTPVFLLPSNTVSSLVIFEMFIRPVVRMSLGKRSSQRRLVRARALNHVGSKVGRRGYIRARLMRDAQTQDYLVEGLGGANGAPAHLLAGLAEANAMIKIPEDVNEVRPGDIVEVLFMSQGR
ncbi:molybdopterin molybdotransferase MoeA [Corynebacterium diphtheriae bv. mitis]|uniref:Molybdopterin molybdenumtransferase n=4 Tax=Corynebacterium diphtheriae TaxID=1717 RepID=Q6NIB4_CORDI|nr:gephyrin-like molybdotransferase Glp [Corynebacterium diphtheriae]ERA57150.1 molybdenum cofactor synthesis domain-containing protein [Corynebacterium diphtheriae DSM 43988]OWN11725.1 molybdopterin molybdenumtransferase [Corynebacterium belfantii]AEX41552.1 putative molybdopterin biosynthesis protein [Corynebacterium diphtheriae 31A]AEX43842.1 putative molybdopterin biosynthesis protein [Corynebacterium diphtheriae 241]AEX46055.1 putative molybdopterin biosynthesis protein [Corynebacterium d